MSLHNQTLKYVAKVRKKLERGEITQEQADKRIADLEEKGPVWTARWTLPNGTEATKVFKSRKEAEKHEGLQNALISLGEHSTPANLRVKMSDLFTFYLQNHLCGKKSFPNAKAHFEKANSLIGELTLYRLDTHPEMILGDYLENLKLKYPNQIRTDSTLRSHLLYINAAIKFWIKKKRLRLVNPFSIIDLPIPENKRQRSPSITEYTALSIESQKSKYPKWLPAFYVLLWEHGRRLGEYAALNWKGIFFNPPNDEAPYMQILSEKQGKGKQELAEIPLFLPAAQALYDIQPEILEGPVFASSVYVLEYWHRLVTEATGIQDLHIHDFRRSFKNRYQLLNPALRDPMQAHKTLKTAEDYITDRRHTLEPVVAQSYPEGFQEFKSKIRISA